MSPTIHDTLRAKQPATNADLLRELQSVRREIGSLTKLFDEFAGTFLNAKFPFGRPNDRWAKRR